MPNLRHQDVQDRKGLTSTLPNTDPEPCRKVDRLRVGYLLISRPYNEGSGSLCLLKVLA
jgi:hypothetical protein